MILGLILAQGSRGDLVVEKNVAVGSKHCDVVSWTDAEGKPRSAAFVRADGDPGFSGGYIQRFTYFVGQTQKTGLAWDQGQPHVSGLGCSVNHHKSASSSKANSSHATTGFVFEGTNHAIWRFKSDYSGVGKTIGLVIDWMIASGRSDLLWAVSYDCSKLADGEIQWDARGPYVQFDWDGDGKFYDGKISGIRWGDRYRFKTTRYVFGRPQECVWDYSEPNVIPYMLLWKDATCGDVELGMVQTQPWEIHDAGGYWWTGNWKKTGTGMPVNWNCPYQLNAYENYSSEKMAWGTNFGYVGSSSYEVLGSVRKARGYPHQGYAVWIVLGRSSAGWTDKTIASAEAGTKARLTARVGSVVAKGPNHVGLEGDAPYQPAGWDHIRGAWALAADGRGSVSANLSIPSGSVVRPTFEISNYAKGAPASVTLNGKGLAAGKGYLASVDAAEKKLYLTLLSDLAGDKNEIAVSAP